ncbi:unnamed protein product [Tilletia laevis]|uniref:Sld7 C-terminal domain-containing protein n=1 Tax=Tilletia laevis TaxID=157183 RepID=A0A9N8QBX3_9BASI|nr:unnamed protein product [Tilletia laevis]
MSALISNTNTNSILQPLSTDHTTSCSSPNTKINKLRILWRGSLLLPHGGVPLPGLSIVSTHLPSSSSFSPPRAGRKRRTRVRTEDVFGALGTPGEEEEEEEDFVDEGQKDADFDQQREVEAEVESDLTLAIEVLRHAPLVVRTHNPRSTLASDDLNLDQWVVSSSTSLSLDSTHWSTIDYLHRALLPPPSSSSSSSSIMSRVALTIAPPLQEPPRQQQRGGKGLLLPPAAGFDVFSSPPNEFAIVPVLVPCSPSETTKKRGNNTAQQTIRLALAQRRRFTAPTPAVGPGPASSVLRFRPIVANAEPTPERERERGLSAHKKRMTVAARNRSVAAAASAAAVGSLTPSAAATSSSRLKTTTTSSQIKRLSRYALLSRGMVESASSSSSSSSKGPSFPQQQQGGEATAAAVDEYGRCLKAVVAATEAILKPELDKLPTGAPMPDMARIAACVQVHVQMYAPPLPRACFPPGTTVPS